MRTTSKIKRIAAGVLSVALLACTQAAVAGNALEANARFAENQIHTSTGRDGNNQFFTIATNKYGRDWHFFSNTRTYSETAAKAEKAPDAKLVNTRQWSAAGVSEISMELKMERITLLASPTKDIILKEYSSYADAAYRASASTAKSRLEVKYSASRPTNIWYCSYAELYVPSGYTGSITLGTMAGDLEVPSYQGKLDAYTTSGDVTASSCKTTGTFSSTSGDVTLTNSGGDVAVYTTSGDVKVKNSTVTSASSTSGDVSIEAATLPSGMNAYSTSGDVNITAGALSGDLNASSTSGDVNITLPKNTAFRLNASTTSGKIANTFPGNWDTGKRYVYGSCGSNPKYEINAFTTSGDVTLRPAR